MIEDNMPNEKLGLPEPAPEKRPWKKIIADMLYSVMVMLFFILAYVAGMQYGIEYARYSYDVWAVVDTAHGQIPDAFQKVLDEKLLQYEVDRRWIQ